MRLTSSEQAQIKQRCHTLLGADCGLWVFGSRARDDARGGDLDLLVRSPQRLSRKVVLACDLAVQIERIMQGRKVDVLLIDPDTELQPIHQVALETGVPL